MAYLQLKSTNPNFSYILRKNPSSGMQMKPNRKGILFAWYSNLQIFNIYFRDNDTKVSYGKEEFEYMDETRYNAPVFLVNAFTEFLNHMKKPDEKDIAGYDNTLIINMIKCKRRNLDEFKSNFTDFDFTFDEVSARNYKVAIKTKKSVLELMCMGQVLSIFNSLLNDDLEGLSDKDIDKYMNWIQVIDAPYYIRHLFSIYFLKTEKLFKRYKQLIETTNRQNLKLEFEFGSNIKQRIRAIKKHLDFTSDIIDIGCGDGNYVREFASLLNENLEYHAIDTNPESIEKVKKLCEKKQIENVVVWSSLDEFIKENCENFLFNKPVILLTEVIEHMNKEEASVFVTKVLQIPHQKVIITTPNKDFNSHYKILYDDMRDEDHKFEMRKDELKNFIIEINDKLPNKHELTFFEIGDKVNDFQPTLAVVIK